MRAPRSVSSGRRRVDAAGRRGRDDRSLNRGRCLPEQVYFAAGHLELGRLWKQGVYCAITNFIIWGVAGSLWWKAIGLY